MKFFFLAVLLSASSVLYAQSDSISRVSFTKVDTAHAKSAVLKQRAMRFVAKAFKNPKQVLQYEDSTKVVIRGSVGVSSSNDIIGHYAKFTLEIDVKDGKYRYAFKNIEGSEFGDVEYEFNVNLYREKANRDDIGKQMWESYVSGVERIKASLKELSIALDAAMHTNEDADF